MLTCPVSSTAGSYAYDSAGRLLPGSVGTARAALRYDALGRMLPSVGTVDRGGDVSLDFADLVANLSQAGRSSAFGLDPAGGARCGPTPAASGWNSSAYGRSNSWQLLGFGTERDGSGK